MSTKQVKFIFVTGGVLSSIGKGISAASIGMLLERRGLNVTLVKMDPYLNVDPGTMSPFQHGEVFVLDDGTETDLDLGHYSRFVHKANFTKKNSFTAGRIYDTVIRRERAGGYLGKTVQVIPHITDEIKSHILAAAEGSDVAIVEVGGTVGDIEGQPFLEAIRQLRVELGQSNTLFVHVTLVPYISAAGELKTKPTQHSVKDLREIGIQPDLLICRSDHAVPREIKDKIGLFCNLNWDCVFSAADASSIYEVPLRFHEERLDDKVIEKLGIWTGSPDITSWKEMVHKITKPSKEVRIGIVGKYTDWIESYKSLSEALVHGGVSNDTKVIPVYIDSEDIESGKNTDLLNTVGGILVPGGFGERGIEGKIKAIQMAREKKIPFFGICLGMQLAAIEFARNVCGLKDANSDEFIPDGKTNIIHYLEGQKDIQEKGATMRLGAYRCDIQSEIKGRKTFAFLAYGSEVIHERHRHRLEFNNFYRKQLEAGGLEITGIYKPDKASGKPDLVEMIEVSNHPWFVGCQFHPELLSKPLAPHPLFRSFISAALKTQATKG